MLFERKLRLEKVVTNKHLRLAVETEQERRARLENDAATKWLKLAMEMDEKRKARLQKMVAITQLRLALETEEERRAKKLIGFKTRNERTHPVMGINFLLGRAKRAPHWSVQSRFCVIYNVSVCMSWYAKVRRWNYVAQKCACSVLGG